MVNANVLASLILSRLIYEASRRPLPKIGGAMATDLVTPFHIYLDEFQSVTTFAMVEALSGIRKFRVGFTLCHQYTDQLSPEVFEAIRGNIGTKLIFRIGGIDAEALYKTLDVSDPKHLTEQSDYEFFVSMKQNNHTATYQGYSTPTGYEQVGKGASIQALMSAKYARPAAEIDEQYERWQVSRHYGQSGERPTVKKKEQEAAASPKMRSGKQVFRSLGQIMLR